VRAPVGRINVATKGTVIGRGLSAIRSRQGTQSFLLFQLKQYFLEEDTMGSGTIFKAVTKADLYGLDLLVPPQEFVYRFEEFAKPGWALLRNLTARNANLRATRDLLLPKLISGEVDVSALSEEPIAEAAD
jgi:type I restriction enzyme S subunit